MRTDFFSSKDAAQAYAKGRPYHQDIVVKRMRAFFDLKEPVPRALDIACGTGLSAVALKEVADNIVALDISYYMLACAARDPQIHYINAMAKKLPLAATSFDLLTVSSAFHWFDKRQFIKESARVLKPGAPVVIYENHFTAQLEGYPQFGPWFRKAYMGRYPSPPRDYSFEPEHFKESGIAFLGEETYENVVTLTSERLINHLLTMTNFIFALENGMDTRDGAATWLRSELKQFPLLCQGEGKFGFAGSIKHLQKQ